MTDCELCFKPIRFWDWKTSLKSTTGNNDPICINWFHRRCTMGKCVICGKGFHRWQEVNHCIYNSVGGIGHQKCLDAKGVEIAKWVNYDDKE